MTQPWHWFPCVAWCMKYYAYWHQYLMCLVFLRNIILKLYIFKCYASPINSPVEKAAHEQDYIHSTTARSIFNQCLLRIYTNIRRAVKEGKFPSYTIRKILTQHKQSLSLALAHHCGSVVGGTIPKPQCSYCIQYWPTQWGEMLPTLVVVWCNLRGKIKLRTVFFSPKSLTKNFWGWTNLPPHQTRLNFVCGGKIQCCKDTRGSDWPY